MMTTMVMIMTMTIIVLVRNYLFCSYCPDTKTQTGPVALPEPLYGTADNNSIGNDHAHIGNGVENDNDAITH